MGRVNDLYIEAGVKLLFLFKDRKSLLLVVKINILFLVLTLSQQNAHAYEGARYGKLCSMILQELAGDMGSMFASIAGVGAVVASAMGGMKMAWSLVIVSIGAYLLETYQELWFDQCTG